MPVQRTDLGRFSLFKQVAEKPLLHRVWKNVQIQGARRKVFPHLTSHISHLVSHLSCLHSLLLALRVLN